MRKEVAREVMKPELSMAAAAAKDQASLIQEEEEEEEEAGEEEEGSRFHFSCFFLLSCSYG